MPDVHAFRAAEIRLSGWAHTDGLHKAKASFWLQVDLEKGKGFFDLAKDRAIAATVWTPLAIEGKVDDQAVRLKFGCILWGTGQAWFDGIRIEILD